MTLLLILATLVFVYAGNFYPGTELSEGDFWDVRVTTDDTEIQSDKGKLEVTG